MTWVDIPCEEGSSSGGVVKVTRELLVSRDGDSFLFVCLCFWYFRRVKSTVLIKYSGKYIEIYFKLKITFLFSVMCWGLELQRLK